MIELTASIKNTFSKEIESTDILNYSQFKTSFEPDMDTYFKETLPSIYSDIRTYFSLDKINIDDIKTKGYENVAHENNIDLEYLFLYMFDILNPEINFLNAANITEEEKKLIIVYYQKYSDVISYIRSLIPDNYILGSGFHSRTPFKVNGREYSQFKILPVSGFIDKNDDSVLYIHLNGKNLLELENHVTLPISYSHFTSARKIISVFPKGIVPSHFDLTDKINDAKSKIIAKTRKEEKIKSFSKQLIAFRTDLDFNIDRNYALSIDNVRSEKFSFDINNHKLAAFYLILAKLDKNYLMKKLNLREYEFNNFYLYLKNGKSEDYYICEKNEDSKYMNHIPIIDSIHLDSISSIYEEKLNKTFLEAGCYFIRDKDLTRFYMDEGVSVTATPDFYFPDGIYINGELCYWIELKRNLNNVKVQIEKYIYIFGQGAIILEEGFNVKPQMKFLERNIQILNGTY